MGKVIVLNNCDFSNNNIGRVTFQNVPLQSLSILGDSSIINIGSYTAVYTPADTTQKGVIWSIVDGNDYATINENTGVVTVKQGASQNNVTIRCTSINDSSIYSEKTISVSKVIVITNNINIVASSTSIQATCQFATASNITITIGELGEIIINSGETTGNLQISGSSQQRIVNISVSPTEDLTYEYQLSESSITIPPIHNFIIVGPRNEIKGDVRAGNYFLLDLDTMKQVVGTQEEVTDDYKEYISPIMWIISEGSTYVTLEANSGTSGNLNILLGTNSRNFTITANCDGNAISKTGIATYVQTDFVINNLTDLQNFANAIKNSTEHNLISSSTNGDGFVNKHIRLGADIDFNNTSVEIGSYTGANNYKAFKGWFDGAGYELKRISSTGRFGLFAATYGTENNPCLLSNFTISGSVTNASGTNGIVWCAENYTVYDRVFNKMNVTTTNEGNICMWNSQDAGVLNTFIDCVYAGTAVSNTRGSKHISVSYTSSKVNGYTFIGSITGNINNNGNWIVPMPRSKELGGSLNDPIIKNALYLGRAGDAGGDCSIFSVSTTSWYENCIVAGTLESAGVLGEGGYFYKGNTSYTVNATKCFYIEGRVNSCLGNAISKTEQQVKSGSLFEDSSWIEKEGYYPMLDNQFAVKAEMLAAIRQTF